MKKVYVISTMLRNITLAQFFKDEYEDEWIDVLDKDDDGCYYSKFRNLCVMDRDFIHFDSGGYIYGVFSEAFIRRRYPVIEIEENKMLDAARGN